MTGAAVYTTFATNDPVDFDSANNEPFAFEARVAELRARLAGLLPWRRDE